MAEISIRGVSKTYDGLVRAVDDVDLEIADQELLVLVGPSGCGKSTLLRMVAGLEEVTDGSIAIGDRDVTYLPPKDRDVAMVFQNYALYPHMTVRKNIAYPLRLAKVDKPEQERRVADVARLLQLTDVLDRRPSQLSGGQRQRVAMGRALVRAPQAFLMDEPLSNLDAKLRVEMRAEIARLQRDLGVTTLYVTHDQVEAMTMGTRVAVLDKGRLQQVDTPQRIYDAPVNLFVATFIGSPAMNLYAGQLVARDGGGVGLQLGTQLLPVDDVMAAAHPSLADRVGQWVIVGIRPEALADASLESGASGDRVVEATVDLVESLGAELVVHGVLSGVPETSEAALPALADLSTERERFDGAADSDRGARVPKAMTVRLSTRSRVQPGDIVKLAVDPNGLHVFDADTGASLRAPRDAGG